MATNIVSQLLAQLGGGTLSTIASELGENAGNTQSALSAVLPSMIIVVISMVLLYTFPQIGLWLPNYIYR